MAKRTKKQTSPPPIPHRVTIHVTEFVDGKTASEMTYFDAPTAIAALRKIDAMTDPSPKGGT